ncbi:ribonuclease HII [Flammeovirga yaeyamensis]|uniref:Ribonuclease HII n=1 Tax=Flammeovirga yaeyamensis TaxID=367791 RepID=A0AAX1MZV7_9BACT|nr:ribonuclease HII [Flammeovirga yaeyamensis]MBB3700269.1 ribonuclease HII [Flammeovirga yaeyamensis]NMF37105.1 ribonuclease HII [Flammeovirga yaeyamensis]QWG00796.1 ribonuclease HII [Flammeovirga yaeyamensis]
MLASSFTKDKVEAGLDEAGRGCLAGPVVAAAVILPKNFSHPDLNDSKKLTHKKRMALREVIIKEAIDYKVIEVQAEEIDKINILQASFTAMHRCVDGLTEKPELLLIDGNRFRPYKGIEHECIVKGDGKYLSIAAASILAKTHRDLLMTKLSEEFPHYGWEKNAGYPTKQHRAAIAAHGTTPWHRNSFKLLPEQKTIEF